MNSPYDIERQSKSERHVEHMVSLPDGPDWVVLFVGWWAPKCMSLGLKNVVLFVIKNQQSPLSEDFPMSISVQF